ncbi:hypothetical protein LXL04_015511 [Taraxacum kok-saghyz]
MKPCPGTPYLSLLSVSGSKKPYLSALISINLPYVKKVEVQGFGGFAFSESVIFKSLVSVSYQRSNKMNKQDFMKLQTCVLRVNIQCACDGCKQKIKKLLNKVDGNAHSSITKLKPALHWEGNEPGVDYSLTYNQLLDKVSQIVITCNAIKRGKKVINLKDIVDSALSESSQNGVSVGLCLTYANDSAMKKETTKWQKERDAWWQDVIPEYSTKCDVEWVDAEDPLFLLYTSGSTGKPKGVAHTTGGYMVYTATTFKYAFDYKPSDDLSKRNMIDIKNMKKPRMAIGRKRTDRDKRVFRSKVEESVSEGQSCVFGLFLASFTVQLQEKKKLKVKEKPDKYHKEKLLRSEDVVVKLIDFMLTPHATTSELISEKEQSSKGKKRTASSKKSTPPSKSSSKKQKTKSNLEEDDKKNSDTDESEDEDEKDDEEHENTNGDPEKSEDEKSEGTASEEEEEKEDASEPDSEQENKKRKRSSSSKKRKSSSKKEAKSSSKKTTKTKTPAKSSTSGSKAKDETESGTKTFSRKKKKDAVEEKPVKKSTATKEKPAKKGTKEKEKPKSEKKITDDELRTAICEILKEVDFNTATFTDILKQLQRDSVQIVKSRKASIKLMIQEELTKLAGEADEEDKEEAVEGRVKA